MPRPPREDARRAGHQRGEGEAAGDEPRSAPTRPQWHALNPREPTSSTSSSTPVGRAAAKLEAGLRRSRTRAARASGWAGARGVEAREQVCQERLTASTVAADAERLALRHSIERLTERLEAAEGGSLDPAVLSNVRFAPSVSGAVRRKTAVSLAIAPSGVASVSLRRRAAGCRIWCPRRGATGRRPRRGRSTEQEEREGGVRVFNVAARRTQAQRASLCPCEACL